MIKKLVIIIVVVWAALVFYNKFMADTLEPFFQKHMGKVDFFQQKVPDYTAKP